MAAGAYGAMVSLMYVLDNLQHPSRQQLHFDKNQIQTLCEKVGFLLGFFEDYSGIVCHTDTEDLARQIAYAIDEAEQVIDCHVVDQLSQKYAYQVDGGLSSFREDLDIVLNKIESLEKELMMVKDQEMRFKEMQPGVSFPATDSSAPPSSEKINTTMVGFDEHLVHIMDQLTGHGPNLQIVPIVGMGGIGKTTLAQKVFDNRCILDRFDLRRWITISQSYSIQDVLLGLLGRPDNQKENESRQNLAEFGGELHKMLFGRRYLIVMDDIWSTEVWDKLKMFFPDNGNGSRIIVTTRLSSVAVSLGSHNPYLLDFLDEQKSWILFCLKAFGKEVCPNPELEKIGKNIVKCCKGLPLAIALIGGLLGKSHMVLEDWELVAEDVMKSLANPKHVLTSLDNSKDNEDCSSILSLSYKHLPIHLKPCFLYMRVFPEDRTIYVNRLLHIWIAEGLVKPKGDKTLEEIAHRYLMDLIARNLILIHQLEPHDGKILCCKVHDILRDLCIREYEKEHFFRFSKVQVGFSYESYDSCLLCSYRKSSRNIILPQVNNIMILPTTFVECPVCDICNIMCSQNNRLRLVKVVDDYATTKKYLQHTRLWHLEAVSMRESTMLPILWNLQSLIFWYSEIELPSEIWEMPQLRHFNALSIFYVDPPVTDQDYVILENLQTLEVVENFRCSKEILKRIPNVKTLQIRYSKHSEGFVPLNRLLCNLVHLHNLETFHCNGLTLEYICFPNSLKDLELVDCNCSWERMTIIGLLPNLESLILQRALEGSVWNPVEGEFLQLKKLVIFGNDLVHWNAEKHNFPKLQILQLRAMYCLEKIPSEIGEIDTLREIRLDSVTESVVQSAREIIEEQQSYGNEDLQLIHY